jgi:hypothetical protein
MCQHEHDRLTYPLDGPWYPTLPALRIASIISSALNNLVVLIALRCPALPFKEAADDGNSKATTRNVITRKADQQVQLVPRKT